MSEPARLLVVVNHAAARARRAWPRVSAALAGDGIRFDSHMTRHAGDAQERTRDALREGYTVIAAVGGDGTLSEVASGFFGRCDALAGDQFPEKINESAALAILPAGTGDDFARGLSGGTREPLDAWLGRLVNYCRAEAKYGRSGDEGGGGEGASGRGETRHAVEGSHIGGGSHAGGGSTRRVDVLVGSADGGARRFVCLNAASLGVGAETAALVAAQRGPVLRLPGEARFGLAALRALASWRERRARVRVDGGAWRECRTNIMAVTNGTHAGGGMNFSPHAKTDDGLLDVLTACGLTFPQVLRELARIHRGGHLANPKVSVERGTHVRIETVDEDDSLGIEADGDPRGRTPVELRVMPSALRVVWF